MPSHLLITTLKCWYWEISVLDALHLLLPIVSALLSAPVDLQSPLFSPWFPCQLVSIWVHPTEVQQNMGGSKKNKVLLFIALTSALWGCLGLVVNHDGSSWFLSGGPLHMALWPLTHTLNPRGGNHGKPAQNMVTNSLICLSSRSGVYVLSPWEWVGSVTIMNNETWQ